MRIDRLPILPISACLTCRCALGAGALVWHGKDLRHHRRLLSPPLQRLLSCPGTAALGRGVASMPLAAARRMGTGQVLPEPEPCRIHPSSYTLQIQPGRKFVVVNLSTATVGE